MSKKTKAAAWVIAAGALVALAVAVWAQACLISAASRGPLNNLVPFC